MNTLTLERKHSSADIARFFFGLTNTSHIQLNLIQDSLFFVLVGKLSFRDHCQHLFFFMTCLTIYLVRNPKGLAQIFVPTTLCLLVYPWEQMLINQLIINLAHMFLRQMVIVIILQDLYYLLMRKLQNLPKFISMMLQRRFQIKCHSSCFQPLLLHWMRIQLTILLRCLPQLFFQLAYSSCFTATLKTYQSWL